jgi:hypothetical protein
MKVLFGMALPQTTGFVESLIGLIGLAWDVPDFSTLSRCRKTLAVNISHRRSQGPLHLMVDSTGIKVEGEREWNARKHGGAKRRVGRKVHLGIDEEMLEIRGVEFTSSDVGDATMLPALLDQIPPDQEIASVTADGACDTRRCHDVIAERCAAAVIPPRRTAKPWKTATVAASAGTAPSPIDAILLDLAESTEPARRCIFRPVSQFGRRWGASLARRLTRGSSALLSY